MTVPEPRSKEILDETEEGYGPGLSDMRVEEREVRFEVDATSLRTGRFSSVP